MQRLPLALRDNVDEECDKLMVDRLIEPMEASEWLSALIVVVKKSGREQICLDLRELNQQIVPNVFFSDSHVEDSMIELKRAKEFAESDALSVYHQVELHKNSRDLKSLRYVPGSSETLERMWRLLKNRTKFY